MIWIHSVLLYGPGQVSELFLRPFLTLINVILTLFKDCHKDEVELNEMMYVIAQVSSSEKMLPKPGRDGYQ